MDLAIILRDALQDDAQMEHGHTPDPMTPGDWFALHGLWDGRAIVEAKRARELEAKAKARQRY